MSDTYTKSIWVTNPEDYCLRLSACLAVDKGIPSSVTEVVGDVPGTWALIAEGIALTVRPKSDPPPITPVEIDVLDENLDYIS
jgi:hypothetical protein